MKVTGDLTARTGFKDTIPTAFGYIGIGVAFGIIGQSNHLSVLEILLMSLITYAGSAQFVIVSMVALHANILSIVLSVFLVNSRMILMSTVIAPYMKKESMVRNIWIGTLLTDETFALSMNKLNYTEHRLAYSWFNSANLTAYLTLFAASGIGGALGNLITNPEQFGLGFALVAMFIGLLYLQIITDKAIRLGIQFSVVGFVAVIMYLGMALIPENILLLLVALLGCTFGVTLKHVFR